MTDGAWIRLVKDFLDLKQKLIAELLRRENLKSMEEFARKYPASFKGFFMDDIFFT